MPRELQPTFGELDVVNKRLRDQQAVIKRLTRERDALRAALTTISEKTRDGRLYTWQVAQMHEIANTALEQNVKP